LSRSDTVFHFSGVHPLPRTTAKSTSLISRDHSIEVLSGAWTNLAFPVYSLVGGTWTSFRAFAEQVTDKVLIHFDLARNKDTRAMPIGGGRGFPRDEEELQRQIERLSAWSGVARERLKILFDRYGSRAEAIAIFMNGGTDYVLRSMPDYSRREITFLIQHEKICHLDDFLLRRSMLAMLGRVTHDMIEELGGLFANVLGWDREQTQAEVGRTLSILADRHGVIFPQERRDTVGSVAGVRT
jgi:glycerol-3-phosphate dehydrogenase